MVPTSLPELTKPPGPQEKTKNLCVQNLKFDINIWENPVIIFINPFFMGGADGPNGPDGSLPYISNLFEKLVDAYMEPTAPFSCDTGGFPPP